MTNGPAKSQINTLLRNAREQAGISLDAAANHLGITAASMSRAETGVSGITAARIEQLAQFYGISIADLFHGAVVAMPSSIEMKRLHDVIVLIQDTIAAADYEPSAQKVADVTTQVYQREIERLLSNPKAGPKFDPDQHRNFVQTMFRR